MNPNPIEIECPACGKLVNSQVEKCPFCCAEFRFNDINDLEKVANGHMVEERTCAPQPAVEKQDVKPEPKAEEHPAEPEKKGRLGKLFGRGKK
jgi:endogenous inhibitor of DNA gyrase (YacG/DUF329 family)